MEIRRFGPGHRRVDGPPGTRGVAGTVIYRDEHAVVSELAFGPYAMVTPHANEANMAIFIVISGGGFVQVGDERARVSHGEAVLWPPGILHGAYTDGTEMRAMIVELTGSDADAGIVDGVAALLAESAVTPARGTLAGRQLGRDEYDSSEGEPW